MIAALMDGQQQMNDARNVNKGLHGTQGIPK